MESTCTSGFTTVMVLISSMCQLMCVLLGVGDVVELYPAVALLSWCAAATSRFTFAWRMRCRLQNRRNMVCFGYELCMLIMNWLSVAELFADFSWW